MTPRRRPARLLLLLAVPIALLVAGSLAARLSSKGQHLERNAQHFRVEFEALLEKAAAVPEAALADSPRAAAAELRGPWATRLEGVGRLGPDRTFRDWVGTPAEPGSVPEPEWSVRVEGLRTRLVVQAGPDAAGRTALASFLLNGPSQGERFVDLFAHRIDRDTLRAVEFVEVGDAAGEFREAQPARLFLPLASPAGDVLALATLQEVPAPRRAELWRGLAHALAALALVLLLAVLVDWRELCRSRRGAGAALGLVVVARAALLLTRAPVWLLPREAGSPTLYGSTEAWSLLGSPADLFLTCLALFLAWRVLRARSSSRLTALACALVATGALVALARLLARDARLPLFELAELPHSPGRLFVLAGLALVLVTAAEAWAAGVVRPPVPHRAKALAMVPLAALASYVFQETSGHLAMERLRSEFAPRVLEQAARRSLALVAAVREAGASDLAADAVLPTDASADSYAAYLLWVNGDLFHAGYESSLDLYDALGQRRSHFGFNLPVLQDRAPPQSGAAGPVVRQETFPEGAHQRSVLEASAPIARAGRVVGTVVGHVLDEPENLPFLPSAAPYLAALGSGTGRPDFEDPTSTPAYVLYSQDGSILFSSFAQPPAPDPSLWEAAARGRTVRLVTGETPFVALPLDDGDRLHVLLLPSLTALERVSAFLRLCLVGLAALALVSALPLALAPRALLSLAHGLRASFYRKLLVALLAASVVPLLSLSLFVRGYVEQRARSALVESAARLVEVVKSVVEDYAATEVADDPMAATPQMNDEILHWLRRVVRQEIHLYENALLTASSKRELFASGLVPVRLPGEVQERLVRQGAPYLVSSMQLGAESIPVAYATLRLPGATERQVVAAVPLVVEQRELKRALDRLSEMLLLATVLLAVLLAGAAALLARSAARPVGDLVRATRRIAQGDYDPRVASATSDELSELVAGFNTMAGALAAQRADLIRSQQLAAWAEMARAIAHEIKNPLTPIQLSTEHIAQILRDRKVLPSPELEACLDTVLKQVRMLREIAAEFSAYAKLPDLHPVPIDPAEILRETLAPYRSALPSGITLVERYEATPPVLADQRVLQRAIVNLVENALQAMEPRGGTLRVSTASDAARREVLLSVEDTGEGLDAEVEARLFEPYFSTKSSGTGLGLAIVRRAVEAHQGRIEVESEPGRGTRFRIALPAASGEPYIPPPRKGGSS